MTEAAKQFMKSWCGVVNRRDLDGLMALYDEEAILIPTFSNRLLNVPEKIRNYFQKLCGREDLSIALHANTVAARVVGPDLHSICGIYCWRFAVDGEVLSFEARFSFLLDLKRPRPILQHHSSQIPRSL